MATNRVHMIVRKDENGKLYPHSRQDGSLDLYLRFRSALNKRDELAKNGKGSEYEVVALEIGENLFNE